VIIYEKVESEVRVDQGDLFSDIYLPAIEANVNAVVITPTCDMEHEKAQFVKFVAAVEFDFVIKIMADSVGRKNTTGDFLPRYYLLPEYLGLLPALYLDFQRVFVVPCQQVIQDHLNSRVTRVASPWREQIAARYAGYSVRVGTQDYTDDEFRTLLNITGLVLP
jgi:hypothetical protein